MLRADILEEAKRIVTRDRADAYGSAERNFALIAAYWSDHLDHPVTAADVAVMMTQLKLARLKANPGHRDSWVDVAGYAACGGEIAAEALGGTADARSAGRATDTGAEPGDAQPPACVPLRSLISDDWIGNPWSDA